MNMKLLLENWRRFTEKNSSLEEANLSTGELKKVRGGKLRLEKFIEKISKGLPFSTIDGREVIIDTDILNRLEQLKISKDFSEENLVKIFGSKVITLPLTDGSTIKLQV